VRNFDPVDVFAQGDKRMFAGCGTLNVVLIDEFKFEKDPDRKKYKENTIQWDHPTLRQVLDRGSLRVSGKCQMGARS